ncbi:MULTISPECIES: recombinase RecT [unclassified Mesorhizobium]|uniref:recombinase RecT n=2 Tax=Mesorhizobium TaxID=68287 RepID=UPI000FCBF859|nr:MULTISPECIES: recombinase RecT [unclassified Mesorhizobium]TGP22341.1 recombinase RecT [Mesorhizobium sp. M1D.F.Ca.ET.231.01.1.1]TGP24689.1 recombinase RecT [Mesorhizobium sp. M1D.F.Ca.ET.234.01.1.1]TGS37292.1 recombinase RecT [Mesorhizobium sp. M1D.F.Ca.ET.184.01.1.1]TGS58092.1 recombinase RecT [Mesorhizobium sp. M1D.F.Ca.ET.183.01.1.1]
MNQVAERGPREIDVVRSQFANMNDQFKAALPAHIPVERFARVVMTAIQNKPELLSAPRKDLFNAAMKAAQDGLLPDGREGALVLRGSVKKGNTSITWQPMIAGIRKKARNSGEISTWDAHCVHANDFFEFQLGDAPQINHTYNLKTERGDITGAYSVAVLKDGTKSYEVMSISEIRAIRDRSDAWKAFKAGYIKTTPWETDEGEMARKTVARRHSKVLPMSTDLDDLIRRDDELYDMKGAQEEAAKDKPRSLAGRLDALANQEMPADVSDQAEDFTDIDPETGEVVGDQQPAEKDKKKAAANNEKAAEQKKPAETKSDAGTPAASDKPGKQGASAAEQSPSSGKSPRTSAQPDDGDPIAVATRLGRAAYRKNMSERAVPVDFKQSGREAERDAWIAGFRDEADKDAPEPGSIEEDGQ